MMTSQFICTPPEIADGRVFWFPPRAAPGSTVISRLRQAVVTAGPEPEPSRAWFEAEALLPEAEDDKAPGTTGFTSFAPCACAAGR